MRAMVCPTYGPPDVLQLREIEKPIPQDDEVLVKVNAASLNASDWHLLRGKPFLVRMMGYGLLKPKHQVLGADFAGVVEAVGKTAARFRSGDAVFGNHLGSFAEYIAAPENSLVLKPTNVSFEEAAAVPQAAITALQGLRDKGHIRAGHRVLINGASGGVGTFAVQIAKAFGAEVTAVCSSRNLDQARAIGADHLIDYLHEDFTQSGQRYDLILAVNGFQPISAYKRSLNPGGTYVMTGGSGAQLRQAMLLGPLLSLSGHRKMRTAMMKLSHADLGFVSDLLQAGKLVPVIERRYSLADVAEAIRYLELGHAQGKLIVSLEPSAAS